MMEKGYSSESEEEYLNSIEKAKKKIKYLIAEDIRVKLLLRVAECHSSGILDKLTKIGGPSSFKAEQCHQAITDIDNAIKLLQSINKDLISSVAFYQLVGVVAVKVTGGPDIPLVYLGTKETEPAVEGRLLDATKEPKMRKGSFVTEKYFTATEKAKRKIEGLVAENKCAELLLRAANPSGTILSNTFRCLGTITALEIAIRYLKSLNEEFPIITNAAFYQLVGVVAGEVTSGRDVPFQLVNDKYINVIEKVMTEIKDLNKCDALFLREAQDSVGKGTKTEQCQEASNSINVVMKLLESIRKRFPIISFDDFYQLVGAVVVGLDVPFHLGIEDGELPGIHQASSLNLDKPPVGVGEEEDLMNRLSTICSRASKSPELYEAVQETLHDLSSKLERMEISYTQPLLYLW